MTDLPREDREIATLATAPFQPVTGQGPSQDLLTRRISHEVNEPTEYFQAMAAQDRRPGHNDNTEEEHDGFSIIVTEFIQNNTTTAFRQVEATDDACCEIFKTVIIGIEQSVSAIHIKNFVI